MGIWRMVLVCVALRSAASRTSVSSRELYTVLCEGRPTGQEIWETGTDDVLEAVESDGVRKARSGCMSAIALD